MCYAYFLKCWPGWERCRQSRQNPGEIIVTTTSPVDKEKLQFLHRKQSDLFGLVPRLLRAHRVPVWGLELNRILGKSSRWARQVMSHLIFRYGRLGMKLRTEELLLNVSATSAHSQFHVTKLIRCERTCQRSIAIINKKLFTPNNSQLLAFKYLWEYNYRIFSVIRHTVFF